MPIPIHIALHFAFILLALTHNGNSPTIATPALFGHAGSGMMALPERAYSERQKMSPIRIDGIIKEVACDENSLCRVRMHVESIKRNNSTRPLANGDVIVIIAMAAQASSPTSSPDALSSTERQAPIIGLPDPSVRIPPICSRAQAWLRPAEIPGDHNHANTYELMAGPYGFGPSLEE